MYTIIFSEDAKRLLDLAGCSARDFSSQIAHVSMVVIRYNILALIKRSDDYETIGGLFADIYEGVHELTVVEKIWSIIIDVIAIVAEIFTIDENELMEQNYTERPQAQGHATDRSDCINPKSET